ncbi:MAG: leucine-rich repeat domain-containing protein, partial [Clostridia bacterium]|nr:leucine-rich repeat domain-containing protein [Clostridia bacterium]
VFIERYAFLKNLTLRQCVLAPASEDTEQCKMLLDALGTVNLAIPFLSDTLSTGTLLASHLTSRLRNKKFRDRFFPRVIKENEPGLLAKLLSLTKKISLDELDRAIALSENAPEIRTMLIEYKNGLYPAELLEKMQALQTEKDLGLRKKTLADHKKLFSIKKENGAYIIVRYKADGEAVSIPGNINGLPVRIGEKAFFGCGRITEAILEDGITEIGPSAFAFCMNLQSAEIPESVTEIGNGAFQSCRLLRDLRLPSGIRTLGNAVFHNCQALECITVPEGVTRIEDFAFHCCESLKSVTLPKSLIFLGTRAFAYCERLEHINIPDGVNEIGPLAFSYCKALRSLTLPDSISEIRESAFFACEGLQSITLPRRLTRISETVFSRCSELRSVLIPDGVTGIGASAFFGCLQLGDVTLPDSITDIAVYAFFDCPRLTIRCSGKSYAHQYAEEEGISHKIEERSP